MNTVLTGLGVGVSAAAGAAVIWGGVGGAIGLVSGGLSGINKPSDGRGDAKEPLKILASSVGVMAASGVAAALTGAFVDRGGALGGTAKIASAAAGLVFLGAGFVSMLGGAGVGAALAD